jgi:acetolactate synthase-1/2/3 large subunit
MVPAPSRRSVLQALGVAGTLGPIAAATAGPFRRTTPGWVQGNLTGAEAAVVALQMEGCTCVFGIPGAQENELWDAFKARYLPYLLATHEFSAACMADGYARATGCPGVLCVVPGPGLTNALSGLGEALLDSVPIVALVGDVARGEKYRPFQVHCLDPVALLTPVTKGVFNVVHVSEIPHAIRQAYALARSGEPGPTAVVIPYNLLIETHHYHDAPLAPPTLPFDESAFQHAVELLSQRKLRIGLYVGQGCMEFGPLVTQVAELLQAPVATSVSGKGVIAETHPLAVGWGFGPHATRTAEHIFAGSVDHPYSGIDCLLAIGVKFAEVSTGFYSNPQPKHVIHVDANANNLGKILRTDVCVHADAGMFCQRLLNCADSIARPTNEKLVHTIHCAKEAERKLNATSVGKHGVDPMALVLALRRNLCAEAALFVDVTLSEHLAAEAFTTTHSRTYFEPTDNQSMGWSIPAALGAQQACPGRQVATLTGDGCFLMSALEVTTAVRAGLPVKFFLLDDQVYQYMQRLQLAAYRRTTATILPKLDYAAFAQYAGVHYVEIHSPQGLDAGIQAALQHPGSVLVRVATDYTNRKVRWIEAVRARFTKELSPGQKMRFLSRLSARTLSPRTQND